MEFHDIWCFTHNYLTYFNNKFNNQDTSRWKFDLGWQKIKVPLRLDAALRNLRIILFWYS